MDNKDGNVILRAYSAGDYNQVFQLIQDCEVEGWTTAYWNTLNGSKSMPWMTRLTLLVVSVMLPLPWPIILSVFYELAVMGIIFMGVFWLPMWQGLVDNMTDYQLKYWTQEPNKFFVAVMKDGLDAKKEKKDRVLGTVALKRTTLNGLDGNRKDDESGMIMEISHLCVQPNYRGIGLGAHLVQHAIENLPKASKKIPIRVRATLLDAQDEGIRLFQRSGFQCIDRKPLSLMSVSFPLPFLNWTHNIQEVVVELTESNSVESSRE